MSDGRGHLLKILGVGFGLAVIIGNTIGGGIMATPGDVAAQVQSPVLFAGVWIMGGLYAMLGALSVAELALRVPKSGAQYVFAHRALGPYAGFVVGWSDWFSTCGSAASAAILVGKYSSTFISGTHQTAIACGIAILLALLQWRGVRWGSAIQNLTSTFKALAFLALVAACFLLPVPETGSPPPLAPTPGEHSLALGLVIAFQAVIFTYDGWNGVIYFSEELTDPPRQIPRAMFGGVLGVMAIYLSVNFALLHVLGIDGIAGQELAAGRAASLLFGASADSLIRGLTIVSLFASINAFHLMAARVLFAMSRDGLFSEHAVRVNEGGTPTVALAVGTLVTVLFIVTGTFAEVVAVTSFFFVANYAVSFTSLFVLRAREPHTITGTYRTPGYPVTTAIALLGSAAFLISSIAGDTKNSLAALAILAASYPAYRLMRKVTTT